VSVARWKWPYPDLVSELARGALRRLPPLATLALTLSLVLHGVPGSTTPCLPAAGPGASLGVRLALIRPDAGCSHGSLALTASGLLLAAGLLVALILAVGRAWSAAHTLWLAAPATMAHLVLLLRRLAAPSAAPTTRARTLADVVVPAPGPQWVPSLRLRRGPPPTGRPLPA